MLGFSTAFATLVHTIVQAMVCFYSVLKLFLMCRFESVTLH